MIRGVEVAPPLRRRQVVYRSLAGSSPCRDVPVPVEVTNRTERANRIIAIFVGPDGYGSVEGRQVRQEVQKDELFEREFPGLSGEDDGEAEASNLIVEELGFHLHIIG